MVQDGDNWGNSISDYNTAPTRQNYPEKGLLAMRAIHGLGARMAENEFAILSLRSAS